MPYSITTKDGITIDNIPDDMQADAPELRQRVAVARENQKTKGPTDKPISFSTPSAPAPEKGDPNKGDRTSGVMMGFNDLPVAVGQALQNVPGVGAAINGVRSVIRGGLDTVGAKEAASLFGNVDANEFNQRVKRRDDEYEADRAAAGREGFDGARLTGGLINPMNLLGAGSMKGAQTVGALIKAGAKAGAVGGAMQPVATGGEDFWGDKAGQVATGAATGATLTPVVGKAAEKTIKAVSSAVNAMRPKPAVTEQTINIALNNALESQGMKLEEVPDVILKSVQRQISEAMAAGGKVDPAAMMRKAQFEAVGLTGDAGPTLGQMTRDPMQFANEKNLSGVRIKTPQGEGNPLSDRFQAQQNALQNVFDLAGAKGATDRVTAGQTMIDALKAADAPVKGGVDAAYDTARAMTGGRAADLERGTFNQTVNEALDKGMWGRYVPDNVRGMLNDIAEGKTPFNVDAATQMDSILSAVQRKHGQGSPEASAIGVIRDALHNTPLAAKADSAVDGAGAKAAAAADAARTVDEGVTDVASRPVTPALNAPGSTAVSTGAEFVVPPKGTAVGPAIPPTAAPIDEGAAARAAFDEARKAARARFSTIESTPSLKAALDEAAPDKFVQQYILNANVRDVEAMKKVLANSPEALAQARAQIADHLKRAAFGQNTSGDGAFAADRYMKTMQAIGKQKLEAFFQPEEIVRMNLAGKVASDINSIPAGAKYGTNTSGTGAALFNILSKVAESPLLRKVPGARMLANQVGEIQTERAMDKALSPKAEKVVQELSPEVQAMLRKILPAVGAGGGAAAASALE